MNYCPTCALLWTPRSLAMLSKFANKVFLPELCEPHVPAIVGQRAALEVPIKRCGRNQTLCYYADDVLLNVLPSSLNVGSLVHIQIFFF